MVLKYSKEERYYKILNVIKSDNYYLEIKGSYDQIAYYTNECIEMFYGYNKETPLRDGYGSNVYFGYDDRSLEREGLLIAQIKGAAHLITQAHATLNKRFLDTSRSQNLGLLSETLLHSNRRIKIINPRGELTYNYIYEKNNKLYIAVSKIENNNLGRVITFLPQNSKGSVDKKIASAIETEAKTSTE